ncbi:MAG TPA: hypothetical protein VG897_07330 [Terriglobales bacterium]|jgi:hypothetical protein|nr:hypothetical protein [Terriglobales bacterium]
MKTVKTLPAPFRDLEVFLDWALPSETLRRQKREASTMEEIQEFYDAMLPRAEAILSYFGEAEAKFGGADNVDEETKLLFTLMLAFSDASLSVEVHKDPIVPMGMPGDIWKPEHETPGWKNKPKIKLFPKAPAE